MEPCIDHGKLGNARWGYTQTQRGGKTYNVHRLLCAFTHGLPLNGDWVARHICGNARCIRIEHIVPGTHRENIMDTFDHGRRIRQFTDEQVRAIRADTRVQDVIAYEYGTTQSMISQIKSGARYTHIGDA